MNAVRRPVLIGTRSIDDSERLAEIFRQKAIHFELLNGIQDVSEAAVVSRAGEVGAITIATNLAGRGTDIRLTPEIARCGGLHVIVAECHDSGRRGPPVDRPRARQGDPGTAQSFVSAEDSLIERFCAMAGRIDAALRGSGRRSHVRPDISSASTGRCSPLRGTTPPAAYCCAATDHAMYFFLSAPPDRKLHFPDQFPATRAGLQRALKAVLAKNRLDSAFLSGLSVGPFCRPFSGLSVGAEGANHEATPSATR